MDRTKHILAAAGLGIGVIFGLSGSMVGDPQLRIILYEISSVGLTAACTLLALMFYRREEDLVACGFLLLAIAEGVMSGGNAAGDLGGQPAFGAGMALYAPALLLISVPKTFAVWNRLTGVAAAIVFSVAAAIIFGGGEVLSTSGLAGAGYGLLSLTIVGWILALLGVSSFAKSAKISLRENIHSPST